MTTANFKCAALALLVLLSACGGGGGGGAASGAGAAASTSAVSPVLGFSGSDKTFAAGDVHGLAIRYTASLYSWGSNLDGQLGTGTETSSLIPVQVPSTVNWSLVSAGGLFTMALRSDGTLWTWGSNQDGQLGLGLLSNTILPTPTKVTLPFAPRDISAGGSHAMAVLTNGALWAWGDNDSGQLGIGTNSDQNSPVEVGLAKNWDSVSAGGSHTLAKQAVTNYLYSWGANANGQLGQRDLRGGREIGGRELPALTVSVFSAGGAHSMAIDTSGNLWAWGANGSGQVGDSTSTTDYTWPYEVSANGSWARVAAGGLHSLALTTGGALYSWGDNTYGQLGNGTTTNSNVPTQVGTDTHWVAITAGQYTSMAVKSDGSLWIWGRNDSGQSGNGTTTSPITTPTQLP